LLQDYILIVDNEASWRDTLKEYLNGEGYYVEVAGSKEEAEERLQGRPFDLVLTNLHLLPQKEGLGLYPWGDFQGARVLEAVQRYAPGTPCIVISTHPHGLKQHLDRFVEWKADMHKGELRLSELGETVKGIIEERRLVTGPKLVASGSRAGRILKLLTENPIAGIEELIEVLRGTPGLEHRRAELGVRLARLRELEQRRQSLGRLTDTEEADKREAIHFAIRVCFELEDAA
jgi:CheY-like chemotaxis protein